MEAKESKILDILTENKKYIIPSYQRPYSWNHEQAEQLINDIHHSFLENTDEYFIGSLICIDKGKEEYEVVDGQQRLTTLSLIFAKIRDLISHDKIKSNIQKRILPIDDFSDNPQEPRLKIRKKEEDLYNNYILQGNKSYLPQERERTYTEELFVHNFKVIGDYIEREIKKEDELKSITKYLLENVYVVLVKTDSFSSSYRLFNVLNTRGLSLNQSDLLKNNIFEIAETKNDHQIYNKIEEYWEEIEEIVGIEKMDDFLILHEISRKKNRNKAVAVSKISEHFSEQIKAEKTENGGYSGDVTEFILELKKSAENYAKILSKDFENPNIYRIFQCLDVLYPEWIPPMLAFLNKSNQPNSKISLNFFENFVVFFEKSYLHRWFSKFAKSQREVICYDAVANINNNLGPDKIIEKLKSFSNNDNFLRYIEGDIYEPRSNKMKLVKYVLLRIDQEMQDATVSKIYHEKITIEHILPQHIDNAYWNIRFSQDEQSKWVNKLGNLTLINGYKNSKAQNYSFDKKLEVYEEKNKKPSFDIAKDVLEYSDWNVKNLKKRHSDLLKLAKKIWLV